MGLGQINTLLYWAPITIVWEEFELILDFSQMEKHLKNADLELL